MKNKLFSVVMFFAILLTVLVAVRAVPVVTSSNFTSNNANASIAVVGNKLLLNFNSSELVNITTSQVFIAGHNVSIINGSGRYNATYTIVTGDIEGLINYTLVLYNLTGGNATYTNVSNILFDDNPTGSVTNLGATVTIPVNYYNLTGLANDTYGLYNVTISIDSVFNGTADLNTSTTVWAYSLNGLPDGIHNISINITDTHNSRLQLSRILTVDTTAPSVVFTNFSSSNVNKSVAIVGNLVVLNFTASELLNTSSSYVVIANSVRPIVNVSGTNYTANYTLATGDIEGLISYSFILYDMIGNNFSQTNQSTVLFDNKPTGSLTSLTAGTTTYLNPNIVNYTIYGLANDTYGVLNITVSLNNTLRGIAIGNYNSSTTVWNYTIVGTINPGQYNITVNITDTVGNIKQLNATIVLDNVAPAFSIVIPTASIYSATAGSMLTLNFTPTDNSGNMSACWYTLTGPVNATSVSINSCTSGVLSSTQLYLSNGTYNITLYANDIFGNNVSTNVLFNVSDKPADVVDLEIIGVLGAGGPG